ncbi:trkA-N:Sodium/hydrogen exchanger [Geminocystis sp. NIES-3708]|uniref:cation:proton antiporter n=1 Tax=Geminocystis sp. NIES-3708 TaxID=1615909 RepID=UPI0005FC3E58|nr:sodium:proton antiporter [Geminocystis sp. NIES-3708]BAQ60989.1 trkA-N:Sodium/hydrogen exchanger [Geminocystis sp. NIES-3708]
MDGSFALTIQIVITVVAGISAQVLGEYLKIPSIVFLLIFGIALGRDGLEILHPELLGTGLEVLVALAVAIILFEGGLNLELKELGRVSGSIRNLVTIGTLITFLGGGMAAHWLGEFPWQIAFLYASLVVVTGPTVVGPLLKQVTVDRRVATLLEGEGVLIDPVGAILAVVVLDTILNKSPDSVEIISGLLFRLGVGAILGGVSGWLLGTFQKKANFVADDLKNLVVLAGVWGTFGLSQTIISESGLMATVTAGIVLRAFSIPEERLLLRFKGQLTVLGVSVLFILLAADLSIASIFALGWGSVLTVLVLMLIVRPLNILICTWGNGMNWRQKFFLSWIAPRGIVSASVASLFSILLTQNGVNGGDSIKGLVFLTIMMTVFIQGLSAGAVANLLKITSDQATGAMIIGCNPLGRLIAGLFIYAGESVVLIDTDKDACEKARKDNLPVIESSALDHQVLEEAGIESFGTLITLTNNGDVNLMIAQRASEEFTLRKILAVFPNNDDNNIKTNKQKINQAFMSQFSMKTWNQYLIDGQFKLGKTTIKANAIDLQQIHLQTMISTGELLPLLIKREGKLLILVAGEEWKIDDEIIYLLHDSRPDLLKRLSGNIQSSRFSLDKLKEVEEIPIYSLDKLSTLEITN